MKSYKSLSFYVVPSWKCNLHCPHCFVNNLPEKANKDNLIKTIKDCKEKYPDAAFILHGGEPTFNKDLLKELLNLNIINSITSNLMYKDDEITSLLNDNDLYVATSWNVSRFKNEELRDRWLCELHQVWYLNDIKNLIEDQILDWNFGCHSKTILPDGTIHNKCTMADSDHPVRFLNKCLSCKYNKVCIPCSLHNRCSFYPKFYELIKEENRA